MQEKSQKDSKSFDARREAGIEGRIKKRMNIQPEC